MGYLERIENVLWPRFMNHIRAKARDYGEADNEAHGSLGSKAEFTHMWRKIHKLKRAMWDGEKLIGEQPYEIIQDLIGHCFLALDIMRTEQQSEQMQKWWSDVPVIKNVIQPTFDAYKSKDTEPSEQIKENVDWWTKYCNDNAAHEDYAAINALPDEIYNTLVAVDKGEIISPELRQRIHNYLERVRPTSF